MIIIQLYNDVCRPILGDKHPRSMGQACQERWAEIWPIIVAPCSPILFYRA
jgi:hypothetical protein